MLDEKNQGKTTEERKLIAEIKYLEAKTRKEILIAENIVAKAKERKVKFLIKTFTFIFLSVYAYLDVIDLLSRGLL